MISAVVVSFNEGEKLTSCLRSVKLLADEIVVVDLSSTDNTAAMANEFKAKIYRHPRVDYVELIRNFAISKASGGWIMVMDPDETISEPLTKRLIEVAREDKFVAVNIPRKNIFFGRWITHSNWWPDRHIRFFKKGTVRWFDRIHYHPKVSGQILNLEAKEELAIIHLGYDSIGQFVDRQNRYSSIEAQNRVTSGERFSLIAMFWRPIREFLVRFIKHRGFLDGFLGLALTVLMMIYQLSVSVKIWEMEHNRG